MSEIYKGNLLRFANWIGKCRALQSITNHEVTQFQLHIQPFLSPKRRSTMQTHYGLSLSTGMHIGNHRLPGNSLKAYAYRNAPLSVASKLRTPQLTYVYDALTNSSQYNNDIDDHAPNNYIYDEIGNLVKDVAEEIDQIQWFLNGKIKAILRDQPSDKPNLYFDYGPDGQRVRKRVVADAGTGAISETWYIRDAQGNVMATYDYTIDQDTTQTAREFYLYGSSRLGSHTRNVAVAALAATADTSRYARILGYKQYELTNHLGNVLATISDQKEPVDLNNNYEVDYWLPRVLTVTDYYPFGMGMPGRVQSTGDYRFGFSGYEKDSEVNGEGNSYTTTYRHYDPRIGRFKSRDPKAGQFPWWTPYQYAGNRPIDGIDLEGAEYITYLVRIYDGGSGATAIVLNDYRGAEEFNYRAYSESFGPEGRGVKFIYQYVNDAGTVVKTRVEWDVRQDGMTNRLGRHGLFMGAGAVTTLGPLFDIVKSGVGNTYDWSQQPIDGVDAAAKKHDVAHEAIEDYQGWLEDNRTLASDRDLVEDFNVYYNEHKAPWWKLGTTGTTRGIDKYTGREASNEALFAAKSGSTFFGMVNRYKEWKIGEMNKYGLDPNNPDAMMDQRVTINAYKGKWYQFRRNAEYKVLKSAEESTE